MLELLRKSWSENAKEKLKRGEGGGGWEQKRFLFSSRSFVNPFFCSRYNFFNKNARKRLLRRLDATLHRNRYSSQRWVKRIGRHSRASEQFIPWKFGGCANVVPHNQNSWKKVNSNYQSKINFCKKHVAYFVYWNAFIFWSPTSFRVILRCQYILGAYSLGVLPYIIGLNGFNWQVPPSRVCFSGSWVFNRVCSWRLEQGVFLDWNFLKRVWRLAIFWDTQQFFWVKNSTMLVEKLLNSIRKTKQI